MKWKNLLKIAIKSILKNRMRSLLTMLGIIIGVSAVIIMVAVGQGSQATIENQIASLGTNLIIVLPGASQAGGISRGMGSMNTLMLDDVEKLDKEAANLAHASPIVRVGAQVIGGGNNWNTTVYGVSPSYLDIKAWGMASGAFFTERDVKSSSKMAVLGKDVADNLFPSADPVGQQIRIRNTPFKVVGVLTEKGQSVMGSSQDDVILTPATTALYRLSGGHTIHQIYASAASEDQIAAAQDEIRTLLRTAHRLRPGEDDDFHIRTQTDLVSRATSITQTLTLLLGAIAGVSLIVGGIGVMNIMLVSVTERTREIGIRMAIGGRGGDILTQFLVEAVALSVLGGAVGILFGVGVAHLVNRLSSLAAVVSPTVVLIAFVFSGAVGVFFGFYPARKAASLNPIDALRYE